ncbi:MAG: HAD-IA family hydrolase [Candidatus Thiodiazotropha sp. (ex Notomyrtea botanica)]|nr:HAD-IA family hydrolase [Candidatus Thiodiazotropha sp. (ex Notomyrtea botanica)]
MKFELLIFDWDGTLMDSEARIVACVEAAVKDLGLKSPGREAIRNIIGLGLREAVHALFPDAGDNLHLEVAERYRSHFFSSNEAPSELFKGAREVIEGLHDEGYLLAVATGKGRSGLNHALETTELHRFFHITRCADETFSKPHPEMLHQIIDQMGVMPRQSLMIGDTEYDLQMAANANMPALGVTYGVHSQARLLQHKPLDCLHRVTEIPTWLTRRHADAQ